MNRLVISFLAVFLSIAISGCDPTYDIEYEVVNRTFNSITVIISDDRIDTNIISPNSRLMFRDYSEIGSHTEEYLDELNTIPFEISIFDNEGNSFNRDPKYISNWVKKYPEKKHGVGVVELNVSTQDFQ